MSLLPFIIALSNIFAVQGLFVFGEAKGVSKIVIIASLLHIPLFILLTTLFSVNGASISIVLTEILVTILSFLKFKDYFFNYYKLSQRYEN
jgi:O-antigen/teichoic acid export membrane protein